MRREAPLAVAIAALAGCGAAPPPASLRQLEALVGAADAEAAGAAAADPWAEARRHLALATAAAETGDADAADRLAEIGLVNGKLAMTALREQRARTDLAAAIATAASRTAEIERLTAAIAELERLVARDRVRRHALAAAAASRRRAAAAEPGRDADAALADARLRVGGEMIGRSRVEAAVLGALVAAGAAVEEQEAAARAAVALAERALARGDLAGVQANAEEVGAGAHRAFEWAFAGTGAVPAARAGELRAILAAAGFDAVADDYGVAVSLVAAGGKDKKRSCRDAAGLAAALRDAPRHAVVAVDAGDAHPFPALATGAGRCPTALVLPLPEAR
jgi:hypothetical protein